MDRKPEKPSGVIHVWANILPRIGRIIAIQLSYFALIPSGSAVDRRSDVATHKSVTRILGAMAEPRFGG